MYVWLAIVEPVMDSLSVVPVIGCQAFLAESKYCQVYVQLLLKVAPVKLVVKSTLWPKSMVASSLEVPLVMLVRELLNP